MTQNCASGLSSMIAGWNEQVSIQQKKQPALIKLSREQENVQADRTLMQFDYFFPV